MEPEKAPVRDLSVRPELGVGEGEFMLTILARYAPEKGLFFLLDALAELKKLTDKPFRCVICGDGEQFDEVNQKAQALGLGETVIQTGFQAGCRAHPARLGHLPQHQLLQRGHELRNT